MYERVQGHDRDGPDECDDETLSWLRRGGIFALIVIAIIFLDDFLFLCVFDAVPPLHYGLRYNWFTKTVETDDVCGPGRYFNGPFRRFLLFSSTVHTIEFTDQTSVTPLGVRYMPLSTRTKDGLHLNLHIALQYRLLKEQIGDLYGEFNMNFEQIFSSTARDLLTRAASEFEAAQLWQERAHVVKIMQSMLDKSLRQSYAECWGLQLMVVDLPSAYELSITRTQVQEQAILAQRQEQVAKQIKAETSVIEAEYARDVKTLLAKGHANYTVITRSAQAEAQQNVTNAESMVLSSLRDSLGLLADEIVLYQKLDAVGDMEDAKMYSGFKGIAKVLVRTKGTGNLSR